MEVISITRHFEALCVDIRLSKVITHKVISICFTIAITAIKIPMVVVITEVTNSSNISSRRIVASLRVEYSIGGTSCNGVVSISTDWFARVFRVFSMVGAVPPDFNITISIATVSSYIVAIFALEVTSILPIWEVFSACLRLASSCASVIVVIWFVLTECITSISREGVAIVAFISSKVDSVTTDLVTHGRGSPVGHISTTVKLDPNLLSGTFVATFNETK